MSKSFEIFGKLYQQASKDNFRHRLFSDEKQGQIKIGQIGHALRKLETSELGEEEASQAYLILIAYLEKEAHNFYQKSGTKKAFFDQAVEYDDENLIYHVLRVIKNISNIPFEERSNSQNLFLESAKGILLTSMTATNMYTEEKAQEKLKKSLK